MYRHYTRDQVFALRQSTTIDPGLVTTFIQLGIQRWTSCRRSFRFRGRRAGARIQHNITMLSREINIKSHNNSKQHNVNSAATEIEGTIYHLNRHVNRLLFEVSLCDAAIVAVISLLSQNTPPDHYTSPDQHYVTPLDHGTWLNLSTPSDHLHRHMLTFFDFEQRVNQPTHSQNIIIDVVITITDLPLQFIKFLQMSTCQITGPMVAQIRDHHTNV